MKLILQLFLGLAFINSRIALVQNLKNAYLYFSSIKSIVFQLKWMGNKDFIKNAEIKQRISLGIGLVAFFIGFSASAQNLTVNSGDVIKIASDTYYTSIVVKNGGTLIVNSPATLTIGAIGTSATTQVVDFQNGSVVIINTGASLVVNGLMNNSNNSSGVTFNGAVQVNGNVTAGSGSVIDGSGTLNTTGMIITDNSGTIFGSTGDCSTGPCNGNNLCGRTATASSSASLICKESAVTLTGTISSGIGTYQWQSSTGSGFTNIGTGASIRVSPLSTTSYRVLVTVSGCLTTSNIIVITVNQSPTATAGGSQTICQYGTATVSGATSSNGNITWTGNGAGSLNGTSTLTPVYSASAADAGNTVTLTMTVSNSPCANATATYSVIVSSCTKTWTGTTSNAWETSTNWSPSNVPITIEDFVIPSSVESGRMPVISTSVNAKSLINSGTISITSAGILNVYGNITNTGKVTTVSNSTLALKGNSAQTITGIPVLQNLQIANTSGGVSLLSAVTVNGSISLTNGVLTTNSNLTVNFGNGGNIAYNVSDAGSISGNVTGRRDVIARSHYISAPFTGATSAQIQATTPLFVNTYWKMYTKTFATQGWAAVTDVTTAMPLGTGFSLSMPAAAPLVLTGTYNHNFSFTGPSYSNATIGKYILVGNPYPSTIDWSAIYSGGNAVNTGGAIYYWNAANNQVSTWIASTGGTNGGTQYIPAMQAFMVATTGAGGTTSSVSINNTARVLNNSAYFRTTQSGNSILRLAVKTVDGVVDETLISLNNDATEEFEFDKDAYKIQNGGFTPSLYTSTDADPTMYSINSLPFTESHTIPLNLKVNKDGTYELRCSELTNQTGFKILLEDKLNNVILPVDTALVYTISAKTTDNVNRFVLRFRTDLTTSISLGATKSILLSTYDNDLMVTSSDVTADGVEMKVYDASGKVVQILANQNIVPGFKIIPLEKLSAGVYLVSFILDGVSHTGKVVLK